MRTSGPWAGDRTVTPEDGGRRVVRVRYSMEDTARLLWREKGLMILVFVVLLALGALAALTLPKTYTASSRLLVQLGQEYVYQPRAGDAGRGVTPTIEDVVLSELEILQSNELKRRVVKDVGLSVVDPKLAQAFATAGAAQKAQIEAKAVRIISGGLGVHAPPKTGAVRLTFEHKDPESSALILNSLVSQYLLYRKEVFGDRTSPAVSAQRAAFEDRLREADGEYQTFL
ncbi:MAG TPA: Wzz/FepE/Etk N-terminal domain-containing protein, partial [Caulobacteraceae bacterium]|nr:Wzz/FepE/Etk N-terminal domain-containing protein [Caulobacteraceae bacterium]